MRRATLSQEAPSEAVVTVCGSSCIAAGRLSHVSRHAAAPVVLDHTTGLAVKRPPPPAPPPLAREREARTRIGERVDGDRGGVPGLKARAHPSPCQPCRAEGAWRSHTAPPPRCRAQD